MRILVTGATGLLGHAVTATLTAHGHVVTTLSRNADDIPDRSARHITADVRSVADVREAVADVEAVCHLAALVQVRESIAKPLDYWQTNVLGTLNVLQALADSAADRDPKRLVISSTGAVYGTPDHQPINESEVPAPNNPYAATKLAADMAAAHVAATGKIGAVTLRAFNIAGAAAGRTDMDLTRLIPKVLAVQAGKARDMVINGDGSAVRDFVHVQDMADAFVKALDFCQPGDFQAFNIGSGQRTTIREVIGVAERVTERPVPLRHAPPANEPPVLVADPSRAIAELGWSPSRSTLPQILQDAWSIMKGE